MGKKCTLGRFVVGCGIVPIPTLLCANCMTEQMRQYLMFFYYERKELEIRNGRR